ncbi:autophagy-related protein 27-domain-containing protein [Lipomyces orientalis]|uniref:Autophagy-related protein 27-domain-containing protein n=1 Tax=Lipomyces orientalis TaxID=1233043 RepID=A0ACC3TQQ1_9ASCO
MADVLTATTNNIVQYDGSKYQLLYGFYSDRLAWAIGWLAAHVSRGLSRNFTSRASIFCIPLSSFAMLLGSTLQTTAILYAIASASAVRATFDCNTVVDGIAVNLTSLAGDHSVKTTRSTPPSTTTMTWGINLCAPLAINNQMAANMQCPDGTQVCGIQTVAIDNQNPVVAQVIPVSGDLNGATAQNEVHLLTGTNSAQNAQTAVHVRLAGGMWGEVKELETNIDFVCDAALTEVTHDADGDTVGLQVMSWDERSLHLQWSTAAVCDQRLIRVQQSTSSTAWSVIKYILIATLLILVAYFGITAYVNYRRGATGVDLLPSSQAVLDIPYVARDFAKKVGSGFSTNSNRDGYAVF